MSDPQQQNGETGDIRINPFGDRKKKSSNLTEIFTTIDDKPKVRGISDSYLVKMLGRFLKPYWWQLLAVLGLLFATSGLQLLLPYLIKVAVDGPITNGTMDG